MYLDSFRASRLSAARQLPRSAIAVAALLIAHIVIVFGLRHSQSAFLWSAVQTTASALLTAVICFATSRRSQGLARPFWFLIGTAFGTWSLAGWILTYELYLSHIPVGIVPLLLFFLSTAPLYVVVFLADDDFLGPINWEWVLDAIHIVGLILVIYLYLVYVPLRDHGVTAVLQVQDSFLVWRDALLAAGLLARGAMTRTRSNRRLYLPVALVMTLYAVTTWIGRRAQAASSDPGTAAYDLAWSIPFCLIAFAAIFWKDPNKYEKTTLQIPNLARAVSVYLPSLVLPVMLLGNYRSSVRAQTVLVLFGLIFSILLFNARLVLTQRRQRLTMEALQAAEHALRSLADGAPYAIYRTKMEPGGRFTYVNPAMVRMLGYDSAEELLGLNLEKDVYLHSGDRSDVFALIEREGVYHDLELRWKRKNGEELILSTSGRAVRNSEGEITTESFAEDVTERRLLEKQLHQAQKMEAVGQLAGGIAHDFNNILGVMLGCCEIALRKLSSDHPVSKYLKELEASIDRAANLTRQLLMFSRKQTVSASILDLNQVVNNISKMLARALGEDVSISLESDLLLGSVKADEGQIEQILMNLAVNSRDAMPKGGRVIIEMRNVVLDEAYCREHETAAPGEYVKLSVSDTGSGMTEGTRARIFEPFFTTKEPGKGTGLGLSVVYGIVRQNKGHISVRSEINHGTTFEIFFPRVWDQAVKPNEEQDTRITSGGSGTILLVEDDEALRSLFLELLTSAGYRVFEAENADKGTEIMRARGNQIDLLLTDLIMPGKDGVELSIELRALKPDLQVILMSGYEGDVLARRRKLAADLPLIQKPVRRETLLAKVHAVLNS